MRRNLFAGYSAGVVLALVLFPGTAHATVARQAVLGGQPVFAANSGSQTTIVNGALWYDDDYNVFYNPAYVMDSRNYVVIQKGLEGGVFKNVLENFGVGVYFNRGGTGGAETNYAAHLIAPGITTNAKLVGDTTSVPSLSTQRPIDFFLAGDFGVKWGLHLAWAYNRDQSGASKTATLDNSGGEATARYWHADLGFQILGFEPFLGATFLTQYNNANLTAASAAPLSGGSQKSSEALNEVDGGFRFNYEGWSPYLAYKKFREGGIPSGSNIQLQTKMTIYGGGIGHDTKVADGVHVLVNAGYWYASVTDDTVSITGTATTAAASSDLLRDYTQTVVPLNAAVEVEVLSWLTLRGGAAYDLFNQKTGANTNATNPSLSAGGKSISQAGSALFRVGSTFRFGKLLVDSAFGTQKINTTAAGGGSSGNNLDTTNVGFDSQTFALVSASYHW